MDGTSLYKTIHCLHFQDHVTLAGSNKASQIPCKTRASFLTEIDHKLQKLDVLFNQLYGWKPNGLPDCLNSIIGQAGGGALIPASGSGGRETDMGLRPVWTVQ